MIKEIHKKIKRSGIIEFIYLVIEKILKKIFSIVNIALLRLRGYKIDYSSILSRGIVFFQSNKNSIHIGGKTEIGYGVRLKAGFTGKIKIGTNVLIDDYSFISAHKLIEIGDNTMIAANAYIVDFNHKYPLSKYRNYAGKTEGYEQKAVKIGSGVWIGTHVVVLPGVHIGDDAVIGAGSVVTKNIPANVIAVGNPAKVLKKIK